MPGYAARAWLNRTDTYLKMFQEHAVRVHHVLHSMRKLVPICVQGTCQIFKWTIHYVASYMLLLHSK